MNKRVYIFVIVFILCLSGLVYGEYSGMLSTSGVNTQEKEKEQVLELEEVLTTSPEADENAKGPKPLEQGELNSSSSSEVKTAPSDDPKEVSPEEKTEASTPAETGPITPVADTFFARNDNAPANMELQRYDQKQVKIKGNTITLTAVQDGTGYVSGRVETYEAVRYGSFSFRINTVRGDGLFPAIWMLPSSMESHPEVDIYEMLGNKPNEIYGVMHYLEEQEKKRDFFLYSFDQKAIPETYVISFDWTPEKMVWYLDNQLLYTIEHNVPDVPMYMILNLAVGGAWPGDPTDNSIFPVQFEAEVLRFEPREIYMR